MLGISLGAPRRLAGGERCTRLFYVVLESRYDRMLATVHPTGAPCRILERVHGFAEIGERGAVAVAPPPPAPVPTTSTGPEPAALPSPEQLPPAAGV